MNDLLQQLLNGGAVVAIIVIVVIFLKKQEKYEDKLVTLFKDEIVAARKDYLERLDRIMKEHNKTK